MENILIGLGGFSTFIIGMYQQEEHLYPLLTQMVIIQDGLFQLILLLNLLECMEIVEAQIL